MKRFLTLTLAAGMMLSTAAFAGEYDTMLIDEAPVVTEQAEEKTPTFVLIEASVVAFNAEESALSVLVGEEELVLNVGEKTVVLDAQTKLPTTLDTLTEGSKIVAYHAPLMTMSIPPQSPAYAIFTNADQGVNSFFIEVASVEPTEEGFKVTDTDDKYVLNFTAETPIAPYLTRNIVTAQDIEIGDRLIFTADMLTMSIPAVANPTELILIKHADEKLLNDLALVFDEKNVAPTEVDGLTYLPLRAAAESMGYNVEWIGENQSIILTRENRSYTLAIGQEQYGYNRSIMQLAAPALIDSTTFVPIDFVKAIR